MGTPQAGSVHGSVNPVETEVAKGDPRGYFDGTWEPAKKGLRKYFAQIKRIKTIQEELLAQLPVRQ